jgi:hypothetical protein
MQPEHYHGFMYRYLIRKYIIHKLKGEIMKNWKITGFTAVLILGFLLTGGCITIPQPESTVQPTSEPKTVLFSDDLSQWRNEWDAVSETSNGKSFYSGGSLHILDNNPPRMMMSLRLNKNFNDFILDVDTKAINGTLNNYQGLYFRDNGEGNYYGAAISADGYYAIQKYENTTIQSLAGPYGIFSDYINTGINATNHIHLEVNKNTISLSVNGHHLRTLTDNSYKEGAVELAAQSLTPNSSTEVVFNNLVITTI